MATEPKAEPRKTALPEHAALPGALEDTLTGDLQPEETRPRHLAPPTADLDEWVVPDTGIRNTFDEGTPIEGIEAVRFQLPARRRTLPTGQVDLVEPERASAWTPLAVIMLVALLCTMTALVVLVATVSAPPPVDSTTSYSGVLVDTIELETGMAPVAVEPVP